MGEPDIDCVIWRRLGSLIEVIYADWRTIHRRGDQATAAVIAEDAGLKVVPAPDGMARWERHPGSWRIVPPEVAR